MSIPNQQTEMGSRKLLQACRRVSQGWFPVNPKLLERIQAGIEAGAYDLCPEFLVSEIQKDFALYMYCLREARSALQKRATPVPSELSPAKLLEFAGIETLKSILQATAADISMHDFSDQEPLATRRIQESMIAASTAQVLSERTNTDPELSYSASLVRQLGLTLIAWNYPQVFKRTLEQLESGQDIDRELTQTLGFSPRLLGVAMARQWGLCAEVRYALGDTAAFANSSEDSGGAIAETAGTLAKLCEVGEALARATAPDLYPTARSDWKTAQAEIFEMLGEDGMQLVQERVKQNCEEYLKAFPSYFERAKSLSREPQPVLKTGNILQLNRYIKSCPLPVQEMLTELYASMSPQGLSQPQLNVLIREVIPATGFVNGCIFLVDPESMRLVPRVKIGSPHPGRMRERNVYSISTSHDDPIVAAYNCNTPIIESKTSEQDGTASIACVLGRNQRVGVLYLELSPQLLQAQSINSLLCFKAICTALNHCLRLR